jgi:hypothetical protein
MCDYYILAAMTAYKGLSVTYRCVGIPNLSWTSYHSVRPAGVDVYLGPDSFHDGTMFRRKELFRFVINTQNTRQNRILFIDLDLSDVVFTPPSGWKRSWTLRS